VVQDTWNSRELPILEAMLEASEMGLDQAGAARDAVPDLADSLYVETIAALAEDDYIAAHIRRNANGDILIAYPERLLPKGRRAVGQWPSNDAAEQLDRLLERLEADAADPEQKRRFARVREALADLGKDLVARTIAELIRSMGRA
jgi:hypothetical protein